ncbi:META domain-containing protein [Carboxylicivirga marina]|uniref:META domain-containing protein n=1 Tax=Carboxylicivirga marina TaxID=2800988 RepID=A0ABS1HPN9_9BACT|nr:META domain-containing protein [Carboxylicivirga marina]MBK3519651.1 META domain-containing protein [Carboxylicivirga marina]
MKKVFIAAFSILLLISCKTTEKASASTEGALQEPDIESLFIESNIWELSTYMGKQPADVGFINKIPTLVINLAEQRAGGNSGCNSFGGEAIIEGDTITLGKVISTKMFCQGVPEYEFFQLIQQPLKYRIKGNTLSLEKEGEVILEYKLIEGSK